MLIRNINILKAYVLLNPEVLQYPLKAIFYQTFFVHHSFFLFNDIKNFSVSTTHLPFTFAITYVKIPFAHLVVGDNHRTES